MNHKPTIEETILARLEPGVAPKDLFSAVRAVHPEANKREIITAAFSAMILLAEHDPNRASALQDFAIRARNGT